MSTTGQEVESTTGGAPIPAVASETAGGGEYRCSACGYGVAVRRPPAGCPMCRGAEWEAVAWRPFTRPVDRETELRRS